MSRIVIVVLIYHIYIPVESINLLGSNRRRNTRMFLVRYGQRIELSSIFLSKSHDDGQCPEL
jgi:hypothetical protein